MRRVLFHPWLLLALAATLTACQPIPDENLTPEQRRQMTREIYSADPAGATLNPQRQYEERNPALPQRE